MEDILEEIVGDFTTSMSPTLAEEVTPQSDGSVLIDGTANVRELNKAFNWTLPASEARTVNGMLLEELEEIPETGTRVRIGHYDIDILDVQGQHDQTGASHADHLAAVQRRPSLTAGLKVKRREIASFYLCDPS